MILSLGTSVSDARIAAVVNALFNGEEYTFLKRRPAFLYPFAVNPATKIPF